MGITDYLFIGVVLIAFVGGVIFGEEVLGLWNFIRGKPWD